MRKIILLFATLMTGMALSAQVSITSTTLHYMQDFNLLVNTGSATNNTVLPPGWTIFEQPAGTADYRAGEGAATTGDTYSFGKNTMSDRALGSVATGTLQSLYGVKFHNNTGAVITGFYISYKGEQWRLGNAALHTDTLLFQYSTIAANVGDTAAAIPWITDHSMTLLSVITSGAAVGALDGNAAANSVMKSGTVSVRVLRGGSLILRWSDLNTAGNDDGLGIDDLDITFITAPVSYHPEVLSLAPARNAVNVLPGANLQLTFDREVTGRAAGNIRIRNITDQTVRTIPGSDPDVGVAGRTVTITNTGITAGRAYSVTFDSTAFDTAGYKCQGIYDTTRWTFTMVPAPNYRPVIIPVFPLDNARGLTATNAAILKMVFSRKVMKGTAGNITIRNETDQTNVMKPVTAADVVLSAHGDTASMLNVVWAAGKHYHVLVDSICFDTAGHRTTGIYDSTRWDFEIQSPPVLLTGLSESFDQSCPAGLPPGWLQVNVAGINQYWKCNTTTAPDYNIVMNGGGAAGSTANEDWLITPRLNLTGLQHPLLSFKTRFRYAGPDMEVKYSTDYNGAGDPNAAGVNWSDIQGIAFSTADSGIWVTKSALLDGAAPLFIAFRYTSVAAVPGFAREWSVDSVVVNSTTGWPVINSPSAGLPLYIAGTATNQELVLCFGLTTPAAVQLMICDLTGRVVYTNQFPGVSGVNRHTVMPGSLQSGVYIIRIASGRQSGVARTFIR